MFYAYIVVDEADFCRKGQKVRDFTATKSTLVSGCEGPASRS